MQKILITGAASAIAQAVARIYATQGASLFLIDIQADRLTSVANDLRARGAAKVAIQAADLNDTSRHAVLLEQAKQELQGIDTVLIAHGTLPKQKDCERDWQLTARELTTNFLSAASLLTIVANQFEQQGAGTIAVISSVAGERGRQSNYVYGSAKGALSIFTDGLRNRLGKKGVHVVTIKPGFVDTPMTKDFKKGLLWVKPDVVARGIYKAIEGKKNKVYLPWFWQIIMLVIRNIPERIFKNLQL